MTTPLAPFANARVDFTAPGGRGGPEVGYKTMPGQRYLIAAFLKNESEKFRSKYARNVDQKLSTDFWRGYIIGFCPIDATTDYKTHDYETDLNYDSSGLRPPGFSPPQKIVLTIGNTSYNSGEILNAEGKYDDLGIGQILRDVIGDAIVFRTERW